MSHFYVSRLERLIRLRRDFEEHLNPLGVELLDRSMLAAGHRVLERVGDGGPSVRTIFRS